MLLCLLLFSHGVNAQAGLLEVVLEWPNEGETLYAGPSSLLYKVPIKGWITTQAFNPGEIEVSLNVLKGAESIGSLNAFPNADGRFEFLVTVNPNGSTEEFSIAFNDCGQQCHSPGDMNLQPGKLLLYVTAVDPDGNVAHTERNITVDVSQPATVPVTVVLADAPEQTVENINVTASTWIYMWRARFGHGVTNDAGETAVFVEALGQAPTEYFFKIEPTVVNGILYEGSESATVMLPAGATFGEPITLTVNAYTGSISGRILGAAEGTSESLSIWAIRLPSGESYQTRLSEQETFVFPSMPIDDYLITVGNDTNNENSIQSQPQKIDLLESREGTVDISLNLTTGNQVSGRILDDANAALPFAWITQEEGDTTISAAVDSGRYILNSLPSDSLPYLVSAPGYYSQRVDRFSVSSSTVDLVLKRRPETQMLTWGTGKILLPVETKAEIENDKVMLESGWLWGNNDTADSFVIQTLAAQITLLQGRFALVYLPGGQAWLYQFNGRSQVQTVDGSQTVMLQADQMLNLGNEEGLQIVPFDPIVVATINPTAQLPILPAWEPTLGARIRDQLAALGVNTAQIVTFITYIVVALSLLFIPIMGLYWKLKQRKTTPSIDRRGT